jgi:hypothetical protein
MPDIKNNISVANKPNKILNWVFSHFAGEPESHVRISEQGRKIIDNPKLSSEMVQKLVKEKIKFINGQPIEVGANGSTISVTQVSDAIKVKK